MGIWYNIAESCMRGDQYNDTDVYKRQAAPAAGAGSIKIEAGAAGKVFKLEANPGTAVKRGDTILVLEEMCIRDSCMTVPEDQVRTGRKNRKNG